MIKPIFIFSLPRSGSTLLQRILASHEEISTVSEPWILLPFVYALRDNGVYAEYSHAAQCVALRDFCEELPHGQEDYRAEVRRMVTRLYQKAADPEASYFLDKTPRYHLICDDIIQMFPDAKFIFLWRNPLAVIASVIETWGKGKWNIYRFKVDMFDGISMLIETYSNASDKVLAVNYEKMLENPEYEVEKIFDFIGLNSEADVMDASSKVKLKGRMGDPTGSKQYSSMNKGPLYKWRVIINTPLRRWWCRRYLKWLGVTRLKVMGYNYNKLLDELGSTTTDWPKAVSDIVFMLYGIVYNFIEPKIFKHKWNALSELKRVKHHE